MRSQAVESLEQNRIGVPMSEVYGRYGKIGSVSSDGTVFDSYGGRRGSVSNDGTVSDSYGGKQGYVRSSGTINDCYGGTLGSVSADGVVLDSYGSRPGEVFDASLIHAGGAAVLLLFQVAGV